MRGMPLPASLPHPHLIVLRSAATLVLSAVVAQSGWAAAFIGGRSRYLAFHEVGAWVTLVVVLAAVAVYLVLRRSAGPVNVALAVAVGAAVVVQAALGFSRVVDVHVFLGVLIAMLATALTSWTYRHSLPEEGSSSSSKPRSQ